VDGAVAAVGFGFEVFPGVAAVEEDMVGCEEQNRSVLVGRLCFREQNESSRYVKSLGLNDLLQLYQLYPTWKIE
jgi:hypothetical protein